MDLLDGLWQKLMVATGACASNVNLETLQDYLDRGQKVAEGAAIVQKNPGASARLRTGAEYWESSGQQ
jgi:hypothetical protein